MMRPPTVGSLVCLVLAAAPVAAQGRGAPQVVDRIVAVVGNTTILASQVEEQLVLTKSQGAKIPDDSAGRDATRRQLVTQMVDEELLVQQAERDTAIKVTEQEIQDEVEKTVQNVHRQFTSDLDFQTQLRAAGFASEEEWRRWLADNQRRSILQQRLIEQLRQKGKLRPIPPTDAQMKEAWEKNTTERPKHAALVSYRQIVVPVTPDSVAKAKALVQAESLAVALRRGGNFAEAAKKYSADSGSRPLGGELGWFRRGAMLKEFEDAAFRLRPGEISSPVETPFGYHIIQVERIQPAEIEARHILIQPEIAPGRITLARRLADSVHASLARGASFDSLARRYADPNETRLIEALPVNQLPADYPVWLATDSVVGLKQVFEIDTATPRPKFVVLELTKWQPPGELKFEDVKDQIRDNLGQQLAVQHYLDLLRRTTYIDVRF